MTPTTLMHAQGKLVTLIAALLHRAGVQSMEEFAALLGLFATTVGEDNQAEGQILAYWAAVVQDGMSSSGVE